MFFLRAEGFSCSLDVLYRGKIFSCIFFLQFLVVKTLDPDSLEMLVPDPYPDSMNLDPQLWYSQNLSKENDVKQLLLWSVPDFYRFPQMCDLHFLFARNLARDDNPQ
jgi:hypothetical protein